MNSSIDRLQRIRKILKIQPGRGSETRLATALGVSRSTLSGWKTRDSLPFAICEQIARDYGQSLDWIMSGKGGQESAAPFSSSKEDEGTLIMEWLQEFLAKAGQRERAWLLIQMLHHIPPFQDWLERRNQGGQQ